MTRRSSQAADRQCEVECLVEPMNVQRAGSGDESLWARAVARLVSAPDRDGRLASIAELARVMADPRCYLYLGLQGAEPVGLLSAYRIPDAEAGGELVYLYDIEVEASRRRRGVGGALVAALLESCREDGVRRIWAGTALENSAARRTFESTGARLEGETYAEYEWELEE